MIVYNSRVLFCGIRLAGAKFIEQKNEGLIPRFFYVFMLNFFC